MVDIHHVFRHILVPSDGTQVSVSAGRLGVQLASSQQAKLLFVYIVDSITLEDIASSLRKSRQQLADELRKRGEQYLHSLSLMAESAGLASEEIVRVGIPYVEIERISREYAIDLIVMGVGHKKNRGIFIGDVTQRVMENVECPVLVVK